MTKIRISHTQFYELCCWLKEHQEDLHDVKYPERAAMATAALGFEVTESKAREASVITATEHQNGRINLLYFGMIALISAGGYNLPALAKQGREIVRKAKAKKADDGTPDMFPDAPELPEVEVGMTDHGSIEAGEIVDLEALADEQRLEEESSEFPSMDEDEPEIGAPAAEYVAPEEFPNLDD